MNFVALVLHGLSVISVYWDVLLVRLLYGLGMFWLIAGAWLIVMLPMGLADGLGLWGLGVWSVLSVTLSVIVFFLLHQLNARARTAFVPAWHASAYIAKVRELCSN
jgi:hypothetical protein